MAHGEVYCQLPETPHPTARCRSASPLPSSTPPPSLSLPCLLARLQIGNYLHSLPGPGRDVQPHANTGGSDTNRYKSSRRRPTGGRNWAPGKRFAR